MHCPNRAVLGLFWACHPASDVCQRPERVSFRFLNAVISVIYHGEDNSSSSSSDRVEAIGDATRHERISEHARCVGNTMFSLSPACNIFKVVEGVINTTSE